MKTRNGKEKKKRRNQERKDGRRSKKNIKEIYYTTQTPKEWPSW